MSADAPAIYGEAAKEAWYEAHEGPIAATHVVSGTIEFRVPIVLPPWVTDAADVAAELVAAWQQSISEGSAFDWSYVDTDHAAAECLSGDERPTSPGAMFHIEAAS
jgi:hypothetical protein